MSISSALSNALTGLTAASRAAELVSSNLANVMTEGYGRRDLALSSRSAGRAGGVNIDGVSRNSDRAVIADRRSAESGLGYAETTLGFLSRLEGMVGTPDQSNSLTALFASFESDLVAASSRPDSNVRLQATVQSAQAIASAFNRISGGIQSMRVEADRAIQQQVQVLNTSLSEVQDLNMRISAAVNQGLDTSALVDQRQVSIDRINEIVPVKEVSRDRGMIALFTPGGAILLDGPAAELGFTSTNMIVPHMTLESGDLSGLTVNGIAVRTDATYGPLAGGTLGALFDFRDDVSITAQAQLDSVARDLAERFQTGSFDPTLPPGAPGLFTDEGATFDALNEVGFAGRMALNASVDPTQGGAVWRLRDGLGAATSGDVGDGSLINAMVARMNLVQTPASGGLGSTSKTASGLASSLLEAISATRASAENSKVFAHIQTSELKTAELQQGVDSDHEMQKLMLIEQAYAANARMIQVVDEMMQTLLRI